MSYEKFYLIFQDSPTTRIEIDEPINFSEVDFNLDQKENGMGRDVTLSGGTVKFRFSIERNHRLEDLLYSNHYYGFESDVKIIIVLENGQEFTGELDFATAETNDFDFFECSVILESALQIFKRRSETKVDMFANTTIDGEVIDPLVPINMLLQAKPSTQTSTWTNPAQLVVQESNLVVVININRSNTLFGIENTYTPFLTIDKGAVDRPEFLILTTQSNLKDVRLNVKNINITSSGGEDKELSIYVHKGVEYPFPPDVNTGRICKVQGNSETISIVLASLPELEVGDMQRGESLWMYLQIRQLSAFELTTIVNTIETEITANSTAYNSITPSFSTYFSL